MRLIAFLIVICLFVPLGASAQQKPRQILTWVDDEGVRHYGDTARIEVPPSRIADLAADGVRAAVVAGLKAVGYRFVTLDLEGYRTGSLNGGLARRTFEA